jgi:hypothetical protein
VRDLERVLEWKLPFARQPVAERLPLDEWHDEEEEPVRVARVVERQDVRVRQPGAQLDLAEEPLRAKRLGEFGTHHLHRHGAMVLQVLGEIHGGHPAATQFPLDAVAVGECGLEAVQEVGHEALPAKGGLVLR